MSNLYYPPGEAVGEHEESYISRKYILSVIDEMIAERINLNKTQGTEYEGGFEIYILRELKQRLLSPNK